MSPSPSRAFLGSEPIPSVTGVPFPFVLATLRGPRFALVGVRFVRAGCLGQWTQSRIVEAVKGSRPEEDSGT